VHRVPKLDVNGLIPAAKLGTGTPSSANFLRGDQTWSAAAAGPLAISALVSTGDLILDANKSAVVVGCYEIVSGHVLELAASSVLDIL